MHVPAATVNAEVGQAKAQSLSYVVLLAATTAISGFLFGFDTAVINGVLLLLRRQFALSNLQTEIAASSLLLGCLLGAAGASMIADRFGVVVCTFIHRRGASQHGYDLFRSPTLWGAGYRPGFRAHAGLYRRDFAVKKSRSTRLVESIGDRCWHSLGVSC